MTQALRDRFQPDPWAIEVVAGATSQRTRLPPDKVHLYHYAQSLCSQKVRLALAEKGVRWTSHHVDINAHENFAPDYVRINPRAVVPTLVVDSRSVIDSATIVRFIDRFFCGPDLTPDDAASREAMDKWIKTGDLLPVREITYFRLSAKPGPTGERIRRSLAERHAFLERYLTEAPDLAESYRAKLADADDWEPSVTDPAAMADLEAETTTVLNCMNALLTGRKWLAGDAYSLAEAVWTPILARLRQCGFPAVMDAGSCPAVLEYYRRLQARQSFADAIVAFNRVTERAAS